MKLFIIISSILIILLNLFDGYSTTVLLQHGGGEFNPFMNWLMNIFGVIPSLIIMKTLFISILIYASIKALTKNILTKREIFGVISSHCFIVVFYSYVMYTYNLQYLMFLNGM